MRASAIREWCRNTYGPKWFEEDKANRKKEAARHLSEQVRAEDSGRADEIRALFADVSTHEITEVTRLRSNEMLPAYLAYKERIFKRDGAASERAFLFHGTTASTVRKIESQGFNRSFCGKNATVYGNGVYFASNPSYSLNPSYSAPDEDGSQSILVCRVVMGRSCVGRANSLPDYRSEHEMFDSTVDRLVDPRIVVTYHDCQALPEFLVRLRTRKRPRDQ
jgi:poly [ADP-ribose] polymerase 10/14/15